MCGVARLTVDPVPAAAGQVRNFLAHRLHAWRLDELIDPAVLLVSELTTNALLHAGTAVTTVISASQAGLGVGVSDRSRHLPRLPARKAGASGWGAEGGRGLRLVDALALEWGVVVGATGKQLWFRLAVPDGWGSSCTCPEGGVATAVGASLRRGTGDPDLGLTC